MLNDTMFTPTFTKYNQLVFTDYKWYPYFEQTAHWLRSIHSKPLKNTVSALIISFLCQNVGIYHYDEGIH